MQFALFGGQWINERNVYGKKATAMRYRNGYARRRFNQKYSDNLVLLSRQIL
jgi:hypothetical protein